MQKYKYHTYYEYIQVQYDTNLPRIPWTLEKAPIRADDIKNIKSVFKGNRCLCLGCRHDAEVNDFLKNGFEATGIDILPTENQIMGDINKLENYFENNSFDIGYSCHSLEHTYDPNHFLKTVRNICKEGLYLVIPIRTEPDIEEPIFYEIMRSKQLQDINELNEGLGDFTLVGNWVRDDPTLPSGAEMAFALLWR
jgi:SAM-dependent methyltransferase